MRFVLHHQSAIVIGRVYCKVIDSSGRTYPEEHIVCSCNSRAQGLI